MNKSEYKSRMSTYRQVRAFALYKFARTHATDDQARQTLDRKLMQQRDHKAKVGLLVEGYDKYSTDYLGAWIIERVINKMGGDGNKAMMMVGRLERHVKPTFKSSEEAACVRDKNADYYARLLAL